MHLDRPLYARVIGPDELNYLTQELSTDRTWLVNQNSTRRMQMGQSPWPPEESSRGKDRPQDMWYYYSLVQQLKTR